MKWLSLLVLLVPLKTFAIDNPYFMRSPRGLLMGDAFTAVNDDDYTLFYNPASLGRNKSDFTLYPFNGSFSGTNILSDRDRFKNFPTSPVGASDLLMDYPVHASAGVAPGFRLFNFGITFLANESFDALLRNRIHPTLDLDTRSDRGVIFGLGIPLGTHRISKKAGKGSQTSLGVSAKYIERTGLKDSLALTGTTVMNSLGQNKIDEIMKSLGRVKGIGWGFDAGVEHVIREGNGQLAFGVAALDIMDTKFKEAKNPDHLQVADNREQVNVGVAGGHDYKLFHYILSADVRGLNEQMDFGKRLRFGAQLGVPGLKLMGGINSGYYSYGAMLDFQFMSVTAGFYDQEIGTKYKQIKSRQFIIYLSLFDFSFDA